MRGDSVARDPSIHRKAKLTTIKVVQLREKYATGDYTQTELAAEFGISQPTLTKIVRGQIWKWVGGPRTTIGKGRHNHPGQETS